MLRNKQIAIAFEMTCKHPIPDGLKEYTCKLQAYSGFMRYRTRLDNFNEIVTIKAFGIKAILTSGNDTQEINFGFLTPEYGQIAYVVDAFKYIKIVSMQHLRHSIKSEAATWGELVFDTEGIPVPNVEFGHQKRDPFSTAAKKILTRMANASKRFKDLGKNMRSGKGAGV